MNKGKVELKTFSKNENDYTFTYTVEHNNGKTSVEQALIIRSIDGLFEPAWVAEIELDGFPPQKTPADAAQKMADWFERLAAAIRAGEYMPLQRSTFKDLNA